MMLKSYFEELVEWVKKCEVIRLRQDKNVVVFLVFKSDVQDVIVVGYLFLMIWEYLYEKGKILYCYEIFLKYVCWYIKGWFFVVVDGQLLMLFDLLCLFVVGKIVVLWL